MGDMADGVALAVLKLTDMGLLLLVLLLLIAFNVIDELVLRPPPPFGDGGAGNARLPKNP